MRALVQRVSRASVKVNGQIISSIGPGMVVLVGVAKGDDLEDARYLVDKIANLRVFPNLSNRFNVSALESTAELLVISQFTLYADTRKGRRPSFVQAADPQEARSLFEGFTSLMLNTGLKVETGRFQEHMEVELHNDGPVTLLLDSQEWHRPRRG